MWKSAVYVTECSRGDSGEAFEGVHKAFECVSWIHSIVEAGVEARCFLVKSLSVYSLRCTRVKYVDVPVTERSRPAAAFA